jgi:hypothetical protein
MRENESRASALYLELRPVDVSGVIGRVIVTTADEQIVGGTIEALLLMLNLRGLWAVASSFERVRERVESARVNLKRAVLLEQLR